MTINYYEVLNVRPDATADEIKRSFHRAAKITHPDKRQNKSNDKNANADFLKIKAAWKVLGDTKSRSDYDASLQKKIERESSVLHLSIRVRLSEMDCDLCQIEEEGEEDVEGDNCQHVFSYKCVCGDSFMIFSDELSTEEDFGARTLAPQLQFFDCNSCSHKLCVINDIDLRTIIP